MTQQAFINLRISGLTEKMLIEALGRRALAGTPIGADELIREWADQERATDNNDLEARIQRGIVDKDELLASLRASLSETESSFRGLAAKTARAYSPEMERAGVTMSPALSNALDSDEAEFTEPPLPTPAWSDSHLMVVGTPVDATALSWPPGYTLYPGKAPESADPEPPEIGGAGVPFEPVTPPVEPLTPPVEPLTTSAEQAEIDTAVIEAEEADQERNPQPRKPRRTKNEMALARNAVTNAYQMAVGNSPWSAGWEAANVAGLTAADVAGANAGLTPYQTRQTLMSIVAPLREQFDEPPISAPDTADHGPADATVQRVEDIVTNEQPPKHVGGTHFNLRVEDVLTQTELPPTAEVSAIHGLTPESEGDPYPTLAEVANPADYGVAPELDTPTDDDIFAQFLKG